MYGVSGVVGGRPDLRVFSGWSFQAVMRSDRPRSHVYRQPTVLGSRVSVTLKWFDPVRGFGFVKPAEGGDDALLSGALLEEAGHRTLTDGSTLLVDLVEGRKGAQVAAIHAVEPAPAAAPAPAAPRREGARPVSARPAQSRAAPTRPARSAGPAEPEGEPVLGTVKWYNATKGFGFIAPDTGGRDVFVHARALERAGLTTLADGQRVLMTLRRGEKGEEAATIAAA